jgi:flavin-dependent dehydrogenase
LAGRVIALEKRRHPRPKVCAGGLIPRTMLSMSELGLELGVPAVEVRSGIARTSAGDIEIRRPDAMCTIVRRDEFDAWLARAARDAGLEIIEDCAVRKMHQNADAAEVETTRGVFRARLLVGADGSGSKVRRTLFGERKAAIGRALMADVPVDAAGVREFQESMYRFDFRCVEAGIHGYAWSFPCLIDGRPHLNLGIYDQHPSHGDEWLHNGASAKAPLAEALSASFPRPALQPGAESAALKAFPIRWFETDARFAAGRTLLAGDAAGVDPLMGEGISCAFEHGRLAAATILRALDGDSGAIKDYDDEMRTGPLGCKLRRLGFAARRFYGPRHRTYFALARLSRRAQELGADWYNGAARTDEISVADALGRLARAVLFGAPLR